MPPRSRQSQLLASAGFVDIDELDVSAEFATTARAWLTEGQAHADQLTSLEPPGAFAERQRERRTQLAAIYDGLLRRGLFSATAPSERRRTAAFRRSSTEPLADTPTFDVCVDAGASAKHERVASFR